MSIELQIQLPNDTENLVVITKLLQNFKTLKAAKKSPLLDLMERTLSLDIPLLHVQSKESGTCQATAILGPTWQHMVKLASSYLRTSAA